MLDKLNAMPLMTIAAILVTAYYAVVGGIEVIKGHLEFAQYGDDLTKFAFAFAGVAGARAAVSAAKHLSHTREEKTSTTTTARRGPGRPRKA